MANYDKPAFTWGDSQPIPWASQTWQPIVSPQPSQLPNLVNAFGDATGGGVTADEWGMPIVG